MTFKIFSDIDINIDEHASQDFKRTANASEADLAVTSLENYTKYTKPVLCYSFDDNVQNIELCKKNNIHKLLGGDHTKDATVLNALLHCLLLDKKYTPRHFLTSNHHHVQLELKDNTEINSKQEVLLKKINEKITWDFHRDHFQLILNELLTNAFYNASGHGQTTRSNQVALSNISPVNVDCFFDEQYFICSVKDKYGSLSWDKFITSLHRAMVEKVPQDKKGGAGLGLYLIFSHSTAVAINVKPGEFTEFFWILEKSKRQKDNLTRAKSLYYFELL